MPQGLRVRVPLCAINLKTGRKSGFFNLSQRAHQLLGARRDEKAGAMFLFARIKFHGGQGKNREARL